MAMRDEDRAEIGSRLSAAPFLQHRHFHHFLGSIFRRRRSGLSARQSLPPSVAATMGCRVAAAVRCRVTAWRWCHLVGRWWGRGWGRRTSASAAACSAAVHDNSAMACSVASSIAAACTTAAWNHAKRISQCQRNNLPPQAGAGGGQHEADAPQPPPHGDGNEGNWKDGNDGPPHPQPPPPPPPPRKNASDKPRLIRETIRMPLLAAHFISFCKITINT